MGKVAIVGVEGSGKTVLMAGLCECFKQVPGSDEPYLMPENQAAFKFMETVPYMLRVKRQWPSATSIDNLRAMRWTYRCGDEVLETVELLDYPGELYRLAFGDAEEVRKEELESKRDEVKKFLDHLIDADTLLVLLNLSDVMNLGENHKNLETVWITRGILSYAKRLANIKHTVLVFTQADRYAAELKAAGGPEGLYAQRLPMLKALFPKQEVMAVSVVDGTDSKGLPLGTYRMSDCQAIMRSILVSQVQGVEECHVLCESSLEKIQQFNSGCPDEFIVLLEAYCKRVEILSQRSRPLKTVCVVDVKGYARQAVLFSSLISKLRHLLQSSDNTMLAHTETWAPLVINYPDKVNIFSQFQGYFKQKLDAEKADNKKGLILFLLLSGIIILPIALFGWLNFHQRQVYLKGLLSKASTQLASGNVVDARVTIQTLEYSGGSQDTILRLKQESNYRKAKVGFESKMDELDSLQRSLLEQHGGEKWSSVKSRRTTKVSYDTNMAAGERYYSESLTMIDDAIADATQQKRLTDARQAKATSNWQTCLSLANEVLAMDATHEEAKSLKLNSEEALAEALDRQNKLNIAIAAARQAREITDWVNCRVEAEYALSLEKHHVEALELKREAIENSKPIEKEKDWVSPCTSMEFVWISALKIWVGKYEVTNEEYRKLRSSHDSGRLFNGISLHGDRQPVVEVNFDDAKAFARQMTQQDSFRLNGLTYRLPSASEWQTFAQCGDNRVYPWGDSTLPKYGNYSGAETIGEGLGSIKGYSDGWAKPSPVEQSGRNDWGLYGVGGNVREGCTSDADGSTFGAWRGASWFDGRIDELRCSYREVAGGDNRNSWSGFRLVLSQPLP